MKKLLTIIVSTSFILTTFAEEKLPADLNVLKVSRDKKIKAIDQQYIKDLQKLKEKYTKKGNLKTAVQIGEIISNVKGKYLPNNDTALKDFLKNSKWEFSGDKILTLKSNGKVKKSWGKLSPNWNIVGMKLVYEGKEFKFTDNFTKIIEITRKEFLQPGTRVK